jgi:hypothetical protein
MLGPEYANFRFFDSRHFTPLKTVIVYRPINLNPCTLTSCWKAAGGSSEVIGGMRFDPVTLLLAEGENHRGPYRRSVGARLSLVATPKIVVG